MNNLLIEKIIAAVSIIAVATQEYLAGILGAVVYVSMRHELGHDVGIKHTLMAVIYGIIGGYGGIHLANEYFGVTSETMLNIIGFSVGFFMYEILLGFTKGAPMLVNTTIGRIGKFIERRLK